MLDKKPRHGDACTRCGLCCIATLCPLAQFAFQALPHPGPCPALERNDDGTFACGFVAASPTQAIREAVLRLIGSDLGCDARSNGEARDLDFDVRCKEYDRDPKTRAAWRVLGIT
jgi:hypothetical protein